MDKQGEPTTKGLLKKLDKVLEANAHKDCDQLNAELSEAKDIIAKLKLDKERLEKENRSLKKHLESTNKLSECREQMTAYYYSAEIDSLNDLLKSLIQRNTALSSALSERQELVNKIGEVLTELSGETEDVSIEKSPTKEQAEEAGGRKLSEIEQKDSLELQVGSLRKAIHKITNKHLEMFNRMRKLEEEVQKAKAIESLIHARPRLGSFGLLMAKGDEIEKAAQNERLRMGIPAEQMPTLWIPDDFTNKCQNCQTGFGCIFARRNHCRMCGGMYCSACVSNYAYVPPFYTIEKVRICDSCALKRKSD